MSGFWLSLSGVYGRNHDGTCETPQPGKNAFMQIQRDFTAQKGAETYTLSVTFSSVSEKIVICSSDPADAPERSFHADVPIQLYAQYDAVQSQMGGNPRVVVGTHHNGFIEFFFLQP